MIIEIKNLPTDRKVKHITFDISFEDDGTPVVKTSTPTVETTTKPTPASPSVQAAPQPQQNNQPTPTPVVDNTNREHKEVPPEMTDMEF